ncbi:unnamed protein product [Moneuplotes crassus]|uniref:EF-hand domain-containing protein n=2 Tax=Euplotes crassus TaxID=5936 RepID=A0AAD1Y9K3_EUPCR|nr:unnamed protein product [Moneuplotes crassus]
MDRSLYNDDRDLFDNTNNHNNSEAEHLNKRKKSNSGPRRYKNFKKNGFKVKEIETDFQLNRNDLFNNNKGMNTGLNQTLQILASSGVSSPPASNIVNSHNFRVGGSAKNSRYNGMKRPVSAVMSKLNSPNASVDLPVFDLNRMRPKIIRNDKRSLYDNVLKLKLAHNSKVSENTKLRTNLYKLEAENTRKDKILEEILQNNTGIAQIGRIKAEGHLSSAMKRHIKDLRQEVEMKDEEIKRLNKNIRLTKFKELETEVQTYMKECERLRILAKGVITSKDPLLDNQTRHELEQRFHDQTMIMERLRGENRNLEQLLHEKEIEIIHLKDLSAENKERPKSNKRDPSVRERRRHEKQLKSKNKEISKLQSEILSLKKTLNNLKSTCLTPEQLKSERERDRLKMSDVLRQRTALESELNKLKADKFSQNRQANTTRNEIEDLKKQLQDQKDKNSSQQKELERFRTLYITEKSIHTPHLESKDDPQNVSQAVKPAPDFTKVHGISLNQDVSEVINQPDDPEEDNTRINTPKKEETKIGKALMDKEIINTPEGDDYDEEAKKDKPTPQETPKTPPKIPTKGIIPVPIEKPLLELKSVEKEKTSKRSVRLSQENEPKVSPKAEEKVLETPMRKSHEASESSIHVSKKDESKNDVSDDGDISNIAVNYISSTLNQYMDQTTEERKTTPKKRKSSSQESKPEEREIEIEIKPASPKENQADNPDDNFDEDLEDDDIRDQELDPRKDRLSSNIDGTNMNDLTENRSDSSIEMELEEKKSSNTNVYKSRVSIVDLPEFVKIEFKLILQNKKIPYEKISKLFPSTKRISLEQLKVHFEELQKFEDPDIIEQICRYLVENDAHGDLIPYDVNADMDKIAVVSKFKNKVVTEDYIIFDEDNAIKKAEMNEIKENIQEILSSDMDIFRSALGIEDVNQNGFLSYDQFRGVLRGMNLNFTKLHIEFMVYEMYKMSQNSRKLNYRHLLEILTQDSSEYMHKYEDVEDDSFFSQSVTKADARKFALEAPENAKEAENIDNEETQINNSENMNTENHQDTDKNPTDADLAEGEDEYINDEEMIRIAETCLLRIANELKVKDISIRELFKDDMVVEHIEDQKIELLAPIHFIEGIRRLGIEDFTELDIACLVNILSRQELSDLILIEELDILKDTDRLRGLIDEMLDKTNENQEVSTEGKEEDEEQQPGDAPKKKGLDFNCVGDRSVCVIFLFIEHLIRNDLNTYNFFGNKVYQQLVKAKSKESTVELIAAKDFFDTLKQEVVTQEFLETIDDTKILTREGETYQTVQEDLKDILSIDSNYKDLIFMKKLTKFIEEVSQSDDLKERALNFIPSENLEIGNNEDSLRSALHNFQAPPDDNRRNMSNGGLAGGAERLKTIEEEDKQYETASHIYQTQDRGTSKNTSHFKNKSKKNDLSPNSQDFFSDPGANKGDSRKRLDESSYSNESFA